MDQKGSQRSVKLPQTPLSKFLAKRLDELAGIKTQRQVAQEAGFKALNIINMMKSGDAKLALDRVPGLAKALDVDPAHLFRLALNEQMGGNAMSAINEIFGTTVSKNEADILALIRQLSDNTDPPLTDRLRKAIEEAFA